MYGTTQSDPSQNLWETPKGDIKFGKSEITLNFLIKKFELKLDPAASEKNAMCKKFYTIADDGLSKEWKQNAIFNPPFSQLQYDPITHRVILKKSKIIGPQLPAYKSVIGKWVEKAVQQAIKHKIVVVGILPAYTGQDWYQDYIQNVASTLFIRGRIHYTNPAYKSSSPNFDSLLAIWDCRK